MTEEQESQTSIDTGLDQSIDPQKLIVQDDENAGRISGFERSPATIPLPSDFSDQDRIRNAHIIVDDQNQQRPYGVVDGLPIIGAEAENDARNKIMQPGRTDADYLAEKEPIVDAAGEKAMIAEVGRRAEAMVADASAELRQQVREAAEARFKEELFERKGAKQKEADDKARELLDKLQQGVSVSEIIPEDTDLPIMDGVEQTSETIESKTPMGTGEEYKGLAEPT